MTSGTVQRGRKHHDNSSPIPAGAPATETLTIFRSIEGEDGDFWTQKHGNVRIPDGWEFLPRGDAFVTRQVKKGIHWVLKGRRNRKRGYTPVLGVFAPTDAIKAALAAADATEVKRNEARMKGEPRRKKLEEAYRQEFEQACLTFLDFAPAHQKLAKEIAAEAAAQACEKHSGRVGRTSLLSLETKADLAVRAHIRHNYTDYESALAAYGEYPVDEETHRAEKAAAHLAVDEFLDEHQSKDGPNCRAGGVG